MRQSQTWRNESRFRLATATGRGKRYAWPPQEEASDVRGVPDGRRSGRAQSRLRRGAWGRRAPRKPWRAAVVGTPSRCRLGHPWVAAAAGRAALEDRGAATSTLVHCCSHRGIRARSCCGGRPTSCHSYKLKHFSIHLNRQKKLRR